MASFKRLTTLCSLSSRFASRYGFSLDGTVSCLHTRIWLHQGGCNAAPKGFPDCPSATSAEQGSKNEIRSLVGSIAGNGAAYPDGRVASCRGPSNPDAFSGSVRSFSSLSLSKSLQNGVHPPGVSLRGVRTLAADIKPGNMVEFKGKLQEVVKTSWTMQGRGGASIQVELRDISSGTKNVDKWRPDEGLERVILEDRELTYLYDDGNAAVIMDPVTFEQTSVDKSLFGAAAVFLKDGMVLKVSFHGDSPVAASLPPQVRCTVVDAAATFTGERKTAASKLVTLDGGARIHVPVFVQEGADIMVRTSDQTFVARAKGE